MNSQMATGQMAQMKWMMYLMPIMFLGFFNNYAAGLSYYYFLANMFTFSQQFLMRRFIDDEALLKEIEENKKKPRKKSKQNDPDQRSLLHFLHLCQTTSQTATSQNPAKTRGHNLVHYNDLFGTRFDAD